MSVKMHKSSGVARNFRQWVRQSVAFLPIHPCSAALPSRPYSQNTPVWTAVRHWAL